MWLGLDPVVMCNDITPSDWDYKSGENTEVANTYQRIFHRTFFNLTAIHYMLSRINQFQFHLIPTMAVVSSAKTPDITLYTGQTPNGIKISITLEELG